MRQRSLGLVSIRVAAQGDISSYTERQRADLRIPQADKVNRVVDIISLMDAFVQSRRRSFLDYRGVCTVCVGWANHRSRLPVNSLIAREYSMFKKHLNIRF